MRTLGEAGQGSTGPGRGRGEVLPWGSVCRDRGGILDLGDQRVGVADKVRWQCDNFVDEMYGDDIG